MAVTSSLEGLGRGAPSRTPESREGGTPVGTGFHTSVMMLSVNAPPMASIWSPAQMVRSTLK